MNLFPLRAPLSTKLFFVDMDKIYVKLVESELKKRGSPANTFIDYNRLIFTSYDTQEDQASISLMLGIPEYPLN